MLTYIASEQKKILRSPAFIITLSVSILMSLAMMLLMRFIFVTPAFAGQDPVVWASQQQQAAAVIFWPTSMMMSLQKIGQSAPLLLFIFLGATFGREYAWGTLKVPLTRGVSRSHVLVSRMLSLLMPGLIIAVIVPLLVESTLSLWITKSLGGPPSDISSSFTGLSLLGVLGVLPYYFLGLLMTTIGRSPVVTIGGGLGFVLIEGVFSGALGGLKILQCLPSYLSKNLLAAQAIPLSVLGILLWSAALGLISLLVFRNQDIND